MGSLARTWLSCSAIVFTGLAVTTLLAQVTIYGRLHLGTARIIAELVSAMIQGLVIALLIRRRRLAGDAR
jgi:hypothetical protein